MLSTSPCRCCRVDANCSRLRCKTGRSTDAQLSNVFHCIVSLQFAILLRFSSFLHRVVTPMLCLGLLDLSPRSLGLSSSAARVAAPPARSSARCRAACPYVGLSLQPTLEAPGGGSDRATSGGGPGRKLSRLAPKPNVAGVSQVPRRTFLGSIERTRRHHSGELNSQQLITNYKVRHIITTDTSIQ